METVLRFGCIALCVILVQARGPLCLHCDAVSSPDLCYNVKECNLSESCFSKHFLYPNGIQAFSFGCRTRQQCPGQLRDTRRGFDLSLCSDCCTGDLCNINICTNGTAKPPGIPCLTCYNVRSTTECSTFTYCRHGEACYAEMSPSLTFNMGCLRKEICNLFEGEVIGKREVIQRACHECCEKPGCSHDACADTRTTPPPLTTASTTALEPAKSCWDLRHKYKVTKDGVYQFVSPSGHLEKFRCDMTTDGGGWTVFQKRFDGSVDFNVSYSKYEHGFGDLLSEFWMGNDLIYQFTRYENQTLRVDLCDGNNSSAQAVYSYFAVGPPTDCYRLKVASYHGDAGDALITGKGIGRNHNDQCFSTFDKDSDKSENSCAQTFGSGWWFNNCHWANLNGVYRIGTQLDGIKWFAWQFTPLKGSEMKFRPSSALPSDIEPFRCPVL